MMRDVPEMVLMLALSILLIELVRTAAVMVRMVCCE